METGRGVVQLGFPAGEGVGTGGWDGTVRATEETPFVPSGLSLWELSTEKSAGKKANADYAKRASTPDGSPTEDCTYIAGSLRRWQQRAAWASDRAKEGRWRGVRAYDVDDIETWLEAAPVTHAWISSFLGLNPYGLIPAEAWWHSWSTATTPALPASLVLAGRESSEKALGDVLAGRPQTTTVKAGSVQETIGFILAVAKRAAESDGGRLLSRTALVDDRATWRALQSQANPLVLIPLKEVGEEATSASNHHVLVPVTAGSGADIELPPVDAGAATDVLKEAGIEDDRRADAGGRLARRSIVALRRNLANKRELDQPGWATLPVGRIIRGALLASAWNEGTDGDQQVLASLTGDESEALYDDLVQLVSSEDPMLAKVGRTWALVSAFDAWLQLRGTLNESDLKRFQECVKEVFLERDPALELPEGERWRAGLEGKVRSYSGDLRRGLLTTLALLGSQGEPVEIGSLTGSEWASYLVRDLLAEANDDVSCRLWASLCYDLPLLAEAAPDAFLAAVRSGLKGKQPLLAALFTDRESPGIFGGTPSHTGLLWALENLAWSSRHFGDAVALLARLATIDPGGTWSNRPFNSLLSIYCPWHPDNTATVERRLKVIDRLRRSEAAIAWRFMVGLLPESHAVHHPTHSPQFREWKPPKQPAVTYAEYWAFFHELVQRLVEDAGDDPKRWTKLLEEGTDLPPDDRAAIRDELAARVAAGSLRADGLQELWASLRSLIGRHKEYGDTDWALPEKELRKLGEIEDAVAPARPSARLAWLFSEQMPELGEKSRRDDFADYTNALEKRRRQAIRAIDKEEGFDGVLRVIHNEGGMPGVVGAATASVKGARYEARCIPMLRQESGEESDFAWGYFTKRFEDKGWEWLDRQLARKRLTPLQRARLLQLTRDFPKSWEIADTQVPEVADLYWRAFYPHGLGQDFPHITEVARRLMGVERFAAALDGLSLYLLSRKTDEDEYAELVAEGLERFLAHGQDDPEAGALSQHDFTTLFEHLEKHKDAVGWERVAHLEWGYLAALGYDAEVPTLHQLLATDPAFFVEAISKIYRPRSARDQDAPTLSADEKIASNAYRLLSTWKAAPGRTEEGTLDPDVLQTWVADALEKLGDADRQTVGELHIGHALAHSLSDPDGGWPPLEIRDLLEDLQNDDIERGLQTEVYNKRGVTSRGPEDGGSQERDLAAGYRADAERFADEWPRTAAVLRAIAQGYEQDARHNDAEAERRRQGLDS
jgi:hypothetical protein